MHKQFAHGVKNAPFYWIECVECSAKSTDDGDFDAWRDVSSAIDQAEDDGWKTWQGSWYCYRCLWTDTGGVAF